MAESFSARRRPLGKRRRGEAVALGVVAENGSDVVLDRARESEGEGERCGASRGIVRVIQSDEGEAGGGRARGRGRLRRGHVAAWARGRETTEEEAGWAAAGLHSNGLHREVSAR